MSISPDVRASLVRERMWHRGVDPNQEAAALAYLQANILEPMVQHPMGRLNDLVKRGTRDEWMVLIDELVLAFGCREFFRSQSILWQQCYDEIYQWVAHYTGEIVAWLRATMRVSAEFIRSAADYDNWTTTVVVQLILGTAVPYDSTVEEPNGPTGGSLNDWNPTKEPLLAFVCRFVTGSLGTSTTGSGGKTWPSWYRNDGGPMRGAFRQQVNKHYADLGGLLKRRDVLAWQCPHGHCFEISLCPYCTHPEPVHPRTHLRVMFPEKLVDQSMYHPLLIATCTHPECGTIFDRHAAQCPRCSESRPKQKGNPKGVVLYPELAAHRLRNTNAHLQATELQTQITGSGQIDEKTIKFPNPEKFLKLLKDKFGKAARLKLGISLSEHLERIEAIDRHALWMALFMVANEYQITDLVILTGYPKAEIEASFEPVNTQICGAGFASLPELLRLPEVQEFLGNAPETEEGK